MNHSEEEYKSKLTIDKVSFADRVLAVILAVIVVVMFFQVVFRYVFNNSITWSEELIRYLFVWITFLGAALCFRDRLNIGVDFFLDLLPSKTRVWVDRINLIIMILFTAFLMVSGIYWMFLGGKSYGSSIPVRINFALYGALPLASLSTLYFLIRRWNSKPRNTQKR